MQRSNKDIILLSVLACFWAVQAAMVLTAVLGFWHAPLFFNDVLLPEAAGRMAPKWDIVIYVSFIAVALIAGKMLFKYHQKSINYWLLIFEGVMAFLMVSAIFKIVIYDNSPKLAQGALAVLIIITILAKIFYPELRKLIPVIYQRLNTIAWAPYADVWWVLVMVLMIYMPDVERVAAMIFMGESFHHLDAFIMSSGYATLCGQIPSVDVFSEYGIGIPVVIARLANALGGYDYVPVLKVMMWLGIIYFVLVYFFVRYWFKSALIAGVAFLLVFRLQMFHYGVSPLVWSLPSASPLRFGLDILWMAALLLHLRSWKSRWLIAAGIYSGFALYYMTSTGMCVMVTFYAYLMALLVLPAFRRQWLPDLSRRICYVFSWMVPMISAFIFLEMTMGPHIFQKEFWHKLFDYIVVFGHNGSIPMYESLKYRHWWAFLMSMVMPFTYIATLLYIGVCLYLEKGPGEWLFTGLLCIYGLSTYEYYVVRAAITSYYVAVLPFVLIACFWFMHWLQFLPLVWQRRARAAAVILSFYALLTNQNYLAYPNVMNFSRNPMTDNLVIQRFPDRMGYFNLAFRTGKVDKDRLPVNDLGEARDDMRNEDDFKDDADLVDYYRSHFNFKEDAALIDQLTKPGEQVALISSFETEILIQAHRAPFFYHFPLLESRIMTFRTFPNDGSRVPSYLKDTISEIQERRPMYVFMEKVFIQDSLPVSYQETKARLLAIIAYVRAHYQPFEQGKYLVVMKLKDQL